MTAFVDAFIARGSEDRPGYTFEDRTSSWIEVVSESATRSEILINYLESSRPRNFSILTDDPCEHMFWMGAALLHGACMTALDPTRSASHNSRALHLSNSQFVVVDESRIDLLRSFEAPLFDLVDLSTAHHLAIFTAHVGPPSVATGHQDHRRLYSLIIDQPGGSSSTFEVTDGILMSAASNLARAMEMTGHDICYNTLPMSRTKSVLAMWGPAVLTGAEIVCSRGFSSEGFLHDVREYNCTYFLFKEPMIAELLTVPPDGSDTEHSLRVGVGSGTTPNQRRAFRERFGCELIDVDFRNDPWRLGT